MNTFAGFNSAGKTVVVVAAVALVGAGIFYFSTKQAAVPGPVACTADAMQCPDGSYVGRTGPNCEFVCPPAATSTSGGGGGGGIAPYNSGIKGTVMAGPTCPVMRDPPDPACADRPLQTTVSVARASDPARTVATAQSDSKGIFQLSLPPGDYVVTAGNPQAMLPRCNEASVTVGPAGYSAVTVSCDTGIR